MKTPCTTCHGEGFVDMGNTAWHCVDCNGVGEVEVILDDREREMLSQALGLLHRTQPTNRRLGRPASPREVVSLGKKLGLNLRERHHEPQAIQRSEDSDPRTQAAVQS